MVACRVLSVVVLLGLYSTSSVTGNTNAASDIVNTLFYALATMKRCLEYNINNDQLMIKLLCDPFSSIKYTYTRIY